MALNIPSPNQSGTGFLQGLDTGSNLIKQMIANQIARQAEAREQQMQPLNMNLKQAQIQDYGSVAQRRLAQTALEQSQESRQQKLMPFMIQQYQDAHNKTSQELPLILQKYRLENGKAASDNEINKLYNERIKFHLTNSINQSQGGQAPAQQPPQAPQQPDQSQGLGVNQLQPGINAQQPEQPMEQPQAPAPDQVIPNATQGQNANQQAAPVPTDANQTASNEQIITPPTKGMEFMDQIAGLPNSPIKAPVVKTGKDGSITTIYPSGKVTRTFGENGETPQQAREAKTVEAIKLAEKKADFGVAKDVKKNARNLAKTYKNLVELKTLLEQNPDATGFKKALAFRTKVHQSPNLGKIQELTGTIQGDVANLVNPRSGIGTIKWAESVKPSMYNSTATNLEMVNSALQHIESDLSQAQEEHKGLTGEDLPFKLPAFGSGMVTVEIPGGKRIQLPQQGAEQLVKDHPDHKIVG